MSTLRLRLHPDPILRTVCAPVDAFDAELTRLAEAMLQEMYAAPGRGLAGPQIGVTRRIFVMDDTWKEGAPNPLVIINPEIVSQSDETEMGEEGCLSIPETPCTVRRAKSITLKWWDAQGKMHQDLFEGVKARIALHEFDHLEGVLCIDRHVPEGKAIK